MPFAFCFLLFSMTTLLQSGVSNNAFDICKNTSYFIFIEYNCGVSFFQIFAYGDVVYAQTCCWEVLTLKTISSHLKDAYSIRQKSSNPLFPFWPLKNIIITCNCQRGNRAKKRGWLGGRIITPGNVGKNSQILRNPLKFAFLAIFGCKQDPIFRWQNLIPAEKVTRSSRPDYRPWRVTPSIMETWSN